MVPFNVSCTISSDTLFRLDDGRYQLISGGDVAPLMTGYEYVLIDEEIKNFLVERKVMGVQYSPVTIYRKNTGEEIRSHTRMNFADNIELSAIMDIDATGRRVFSCGAEYLFVTPQLKMELESAFKYFHFTEGLSWFAGT